MLQNLNFPEFHQVCLVVFMLVYRDIFNKSNVLHLEKICSKTKLHQKIYKYCWIAAQKKENDNEGEQR